MDEDYLIGLQKQVKQEELQIRKLQEYKEKLQKIINNLRSEKDEARESSKIFVGEQLKNITKEIKFATEKAEKEIERSEGKIKQINDIAQALKEEGDAVDKKRVQIQTDIVALESNKKEIESKMAKAEKYLCIAKKSIEDVGKDKIKTTKESKIASESLEKAEEVLVGIEDYKKNVLQKLQEEKDILNEKDKVLNGGYAALGAGIKWVKIEKAKIKDEWVSLMKARDYINKRNGS